MPIEWKTVPNTNGKIEVNNVGQVRSLLRGEPYILKTQTDSKGYLRVKITINRLSKTYKVHRLVAEAFISNPNNLPQVNHKDGDKTNNSVENLEWISNIDNCRHAIAHGLWDSVIEGSQRVNTEKQKPVIATRKEETIEFDSVSDAERYFNSRHISDVCKGKRPHVKGWHFAYREEVMRHEDTDITETTA